jgi:hypothetical protein
MESRTLYSRSGLGWFTILTLVVFVLVGIWMILDGVWWGWLEVGLCSFGLVMLIVTGLSGKHWLRLGPDGFQIGPTFKEFRVAWSEIKQFFLTSDGRTVVYEFFPDPSVPLDPNAEEDENYSYLPETYGLSAQELLELLNRYKQSSR